MLHTFAPSIVRYFLPYSYSIDIVLFDFGHAAFLADTDSEAIVIHELSGEMQNLLATTVHEVHVCPSTINAHQPSMDRTRS